MREREKITFLPTTIHQNRAIDHIDQLFVAAFYVHPVWRYRYTWQRGVIKT